MAPPLTGERLLLAALLLFAAGVFLTGIGWGLPSRRVDPYLFGSHPVWSGREIQSLAERGAAAPWDDPARGADVAANPALQHRGAPVLVNATDSDRAQIVRRYRLFSYQPDEMITFMSLARMHPGRLDLDPRLYQYGGLWIYPVGVLLKIASVLHAVDLHAGPDGLAYYLDHPEDFGRFYVVARLYVVAWGLLGVVLVYRIVRQITTQRGAAAGAALLFVLMPVTVNMAHEAKPHLPGAVLVLLAVMAAARYVRRGTLRDALVAGAACGTALGMVLATLPVFVILPLMTLLRPLSWARRLRVTLAAAGAGAAVFAITNPYVVLHLFSGREVLRSNLGNSASMYHVGRPLAGLFNEASLMVEGMSLPLALAGVIGAIALGVRAVRMRGAASEAESSRRALGLLLAAPAVLTAAQFALIGAGKPGEFGRFLLLPDLFLMIEAVVAVSTFARIPNGPLTRSKLARLSRPAIMAALVAATAVRGAVYLRGFVIDSGDVTPRLRDAELLRLLNRAGEAKTMAVVADPAPYCLPPVDLFRWKIVKLPLGPDGQAAADAWGAARAGGVPADVLVRAVERPLGGSALLSTRISWAAKPVEISQPPPYHGSSLYPEP